MASKTKAFGYLRVSGKGQLDGDGFDRQRDAIEKYARMSRVVVTGWYEDAGVSGKTELEGRIGLAALLDQIESNGVKMVLVESADRLARDTVVSELIIRQFRSAGAKVISANGGADLTEGDDSNPTAKLIRQILAAVAEFDRCVIVLKLRAARDRKRRTVGRCEGRKPFGYLPAEIPILQLILEMRRAVKGKKRTPFADIAAKLNADGVSTRTGKPWVPGTVYKIVLAHAPQLTKALE